MAREYKTVRLSYEAKVWINELILKRNTELQKEIKEGLLGKLEDKMFELNPQLLDGVSISLVLKVTNGSVIEQAVRATREYDIEKWRKVMAEMEVAKKKIQVVDVTDVTPRLYLNVEILDELEQLRYKLRADGDCLPRLSYVIKLVVFAFYSIYVCKI